MKYDFTSILDRAGHDALAVDVPASYEAPFDVPRKEGFDIIPMWVADMNFPVCPSIQQAIAGRLQHPAFGYYEPRKEYYDAIIRWQTVRNHVCNLQQEDIGYENGVLGGLLSAANILASKGDPILVHSPTYIGFTHALNDDGYEIVDSPLIKDENDRWTMDYADMEKKIIEHHIHAAILCNPHNPCGRAWTKEELSKAMDLFEKHHVYVIADEIWSDIMLGGHVHTPVQSVNDYARSHTVALYAPSKTFNLAGLIGSYHIVYDPWLRDRMNSETKKSHYNSMNVLSMYALIGAYQPEGYAWTDELLQVLTNNADYACRFIKKNFTGVSVSHPEGTYMLFADCTEYCNAHQISLDEILHRAYQVGVCFQDGRPFHSSDCIRINLALPFSRVQEAFDRMQKYVFTK
ncbi:MAG: aminotransferase class I/II-fold pyridoxal phosphate-dependent enzyme [Solobacterium sp.]|jgi:cystathionine beta-lyase|nr:aminotransferase class I/II-fold pyridoxal phosphate-dependent enzyme [Solobacterium sp.]MCH4206429.1 aminotransferase class I/II-fold pyridoxal phosphate-dependent enzyme [Solobacterium sp.]MCH4227935.1 aminotransferase class I/II-fold pyridoxal phosphate-dependent enzyme [Solobacterium sp.]MCH4283354.1 aminotransferase class I/II-fold pyridoxal phosphate-dependent enzyme [Solobacterium sp.]